MHIYALARGLISSIKEWEAFMSSQYLPFEVLEKGQKKPTPYLAQLQVREVKLYEIICPKECEDKVMSMLKPTTSKGFGGKWGMLVNPLRKLLGLKKCSTNWKPALLPPAEGLSLITIGTKDDKMGWEAKKPKDLIQKGGIPKEFL